jgi:hypothetical protein
MAIVKTKGTDPKTAADAAPMSKEEKAAKLAAAKAMADAQLSFGKKANNVDQTTSTDVVKINAAAAKALLEETMNAIQFEGKLSPKDLQDFVTAFNAEAASQTDRAIRDTTSTSSGAGTPTDIGKSRTDSFTTKFLSYFNPKQFASDYLWAKVNFKKEATLGGVALQALSQVRNAVKDFNSSMVSDVEIQQTAKEIASGKKTIAQYNAELAQKAAMDYPQYADRFAKTPGASVRDFASPVIKILANTWEVDPSTIDLNDPEVDRLLRPDGIGGKVALPSLGDVQKAAYSSKRFSTTQQGINMGRDSAFAFARMMGYGV